MIVVAKLKAKEGHEEKMEQILRDMVPKVEAEPGTLTYTLHRAQKDPRTFMFYEKYQDAEALTQHSSTPHFKELFNAMKSILDGAPEIEMYDELAALNK